MRDYFGRYFNNSVNVPLADVDNNGTLDVVTIVPSLNHLAWLPNTEGSFGEPNFMDSTTDGLEAITTADLDGDGDLDVVVGTKYDNKVAWYENAGNGEFGFQQVIHIPSDEGVRQIWTGDIDGDSDVDIAAFVEINDHLHSY